MKIRAWLQNESQQKLKNIAQKYSLKITSAPEDMEMVLSEQEERLGFVQKRGFHFTTSNFSKLRPLVASQPMAKALGRNKKLKVLDCTAGWGLDAALMALSGFRVLAFEQNQLLAAILQDEMKHNSSLPLEFRHGDSFEYLSSISDSERPDIVFIDPMFIEKSKGAKSEKSIQVLQNLVEPSPLTEEKLKLAIEKAKSHVVVKQNKRAERLNIRPSATFEGQSIRFDVYRSTYKP